MTVLGNDDPDAANTLDALVNVMEVTRVENQAHENSIFPILRKFLGVEWSGAY